MCEYVYAVNIIASSIVSFLYNVDMFGKGLSNVSNSFVYLCKKICLI